MTPFQWLGTLLSILVAALLIAAGFVMWAKRAARRPPPESGWLTDEMVDEIIHEGHLHDQHVPDRGLDLGEIRREEDRFWSESWDEPDPYLE